MSARLLPACLAAALFAGPVLAAPCEKKPHLVTATYPVADLLAMDAVCRARCAQPLQLPGPVGSSLAAPTAVIPAGGREPAPRDDTPAEDRLMDLITSTIAPQTWDCRGGSGTMNYYPLAQALVINQPPDVQEQIADLLAALRRLQGEEVALEVRVIGVAEDVMTQLAADMPPALTPPGGTAAAPQVRFLDDKQVYQFLETIQGDRRTDVHQAPKIILLNGQAGDIDLTEKQFFITGLEVMAQPGGPLTFVPKNETFETGLKMSARPVVSADQRFVRLDLRVKQTELAGMVPLVPVTAPVERQEPDGTTSEPVPFTQYVQRPNFDAHALDVTVSIPAGGTALIRGWRHMHEARQEFEPPVLSKIPYVSRLFKNVAYGREPEQVLILVTARVVAPEEKEEKVAATPACPRAEPAPGGAEESEAVAPEKKPAQTSGKAEKAREKKVARLVKKYHQACADRDLETAGKLARMALKLDPACFAK